MHYLPNSIQRVIDDNPIVTVDGRTLLLTDPPTTLYKDLDAVRYDDRCFTKITFDM